MGKSLFFSVSCYFLTIDAPLEICYNLQGLR